MPPIAPGGNANAAANPTPFNVNMPTEGQVFKAAGGGNPWPTLYKVQNGQMVAFDSREAAGGGANRFDVSPYVDYASLPEYNLGDIGSVLKSGSASQVNDINSFLAGTNFSKTSNTVTLNKPGSGGTPATPAEIAAQKNNPAWVNPPTPATTTAPVLNSNLPGGQAKTLYDYFSARGQALPPIADRAAQYQQLGLGKAAEYTGTALQNENLLSALQRSDYAKTTIGNPATNPNPATDPTNSTPAGTALSTTLSGGSASETMDNYQTFLATALGKTWDQLQSDEAAVGTMIAGMKPADQILKDAMDAAGVTSGNTLLKSLDAEIKKQTDILNDLPNDIKTTLQDVGVSQAQLDRLVAKESKGPTDALNKLLSERNATSSEIDKAMTFAKNFADTQVAGQAAKLAALEWQVTSERGDYNTLSTQAKDILTQAIQGKKDVLSIAKTAAGNGAPQGVVQKILDSGSAQNALLAAGSYMVAPAKAPADGSAAATAQTISQFQSKFVPGARLPDGTPVLDQNGYVTPVAWHAAIADAVAHGLSRDDFISQFGHFLYTETDPNDSTKIKISASYGLSPAEAKKVTG